MHIIQFCPRRPNDTCFTMCSSWIRNGGSNWSRTSEFHLSYCNHHLMQRWHSSNEGTGIAMSSADADQRVFHCHYKEHSLPLPLGMNCSRRVRWPTICCHIFRDRRERQRILSATSQNLVIKKFVIETISQLVSISIPRYWSLRSYFSQLITIPMSRQTSKRSSRYSSWQGIDSATISKSYRWRNCQIPLLWAHYNSRKISLVKAWCAVKRLKHYTVNWKISPLKVIQR